MLKILLSDIRNWNPSKIMVTESLTLKYGDFPLQRLDQLVEIVGERQIIPKGVRTLDARNLDASGAWRSQTATFDSHGLAANSILGLRLNDLVLYPGKPPLLITPEESGLAFVGNFMALRPRSDPLGLWLWGLFNTTLGRAWLERMSSANGSVASRFSDTLLSAAVATLHSDDKDLLAPIRQLSNVIQAKTRELRETNSGFQSWFRRIRITSHTDWTIIFASETSLSAFAGVPVSNLIENVEVGKVGTESPIAGDDSFPVVIHRTISKGEYGDSTCQSGLRVIKAGTLVITSNGLRSLAAVTDRDAFLGKGVFGLQLKAGVDPSWLRDFFNSETAQVQRKTLVNGVAIPFLTKSDVGRFMVPATFDVERQESQSLREACDVIFGC